MNDPIREWDKKCAQEEKWAETQDKCDECGEVLVNNGDHFFIIQNMMYCEECMMHRFRRWID